MSLDLTSLEESLTALEQVLSRSEDAEFMEQQDAFTRNAIRAGVIKHFEIVYEQSWKFMQRWLRENQSPEAADHPRTRKDLIRMSAQRGLIQAVEPWFRYGESRNLTTHTYNLETANSVYEQAAPLVEDARYLLAQLTAGND